MAEKNWMDRATRCPICGGRACRWRERLSPLKRHCRTCGRSCYTPWWAAASVGAVMALSCALTVYLDVRCRPGWDVLGVIVEGVLPVSFLFSSLSITWLVPLRPGLDLDRVFRSGARATRVLDYAPEHVFAAMSNALRRSGQHKLIGKDPETHTISVFRSQTKNFPAVSVTVLLECRPDGRCGVVIEPVDELSADCLTDLCQMTEDELELFRYPKAEAAARYSKK